MCGNGPPIGGRGGTKPTHQRRAASPKTRVAGRRLRATTPASRKSGFLARCSRAARTCARPTIAAAIVRLHAMPSRSIRPPATSDSDVSFEKEESHEDQKGRCRGEKQDKG